MKTRISVQERLKDLRVERGLNLEELAQETGISKSALGSYENDNDEYKEINHGSLLKLADFYQVSVDYLLGLTNNRKYENTPIEELHLSDEVVELLKSERFNNRLLCEIISHEKFKELLADAEIYVDGIATMHFHDTNSSLAALRAMVLEEHPEAAADRAIKVLEACQIEEEDFFCHVTHKTWDRIPRLPMNLYGKYKRPCNLRGTGFSNSRRYSARRSGSNTSGSHKRNEAF